MKKNTASQTVACQMISATDGSAFTGSVTCYVQGDSSAQAIGSVSSGACTHRGNGEHTYPPAQAETNYDRVSFTFIGTGAVPATVHRDTDAATSAADIQSRIPTALTTNGNMKSSLLEILTTALTETSAGYLSLAFKKLFDIASPIFTSASTNQTGDGYARLGAPVGASISADVAAVKGVLPTALTSNGNIKASLVEIISTTLTETAGLIAAGFKQFFNIASPTSTMNTVTTTTTATNLTNAPTAGDLTATMKASVTAAVPTAAANRAEMDLNSVRLDTTVSSRLATSGYTAPDNADILLIKAKTDNLPASPADESLVIAATNAIKTELDLVKAKTDNVDVVVSTRMAASSYTAPDNTDIALIKAKTDNIPASPAAVSDIPSADDIATDVVGALASADATVDAIAQGVTEYMDANSTQLTGIKTKTDALPGDPVSTANMGGYFDDVQAKLGTPAVTIAADIAAIPTTGGSGGDAGGGVLIAYLGFTSSHPGDYYNIVQGEQKRLTLVVEAIGRFVASSATSITVSFQDSAGVTVSVVNADVTRVTEAIDLQVLRVTLSAIQTAAMAPGVVQVELDFDNQKAILQNSIQIVKEL